MKIMQRLRTDEELKAMRAEWKRKRNEIGDEFPPYNLDEYGGIEDYKQQIRKRLDTVS